MAEIKIVTIDELRQMNDQDTLVMDGKGRSVIRDPSRDELAPQEPEPQQKGHKERGQSR